MERLEGLRRADLGVEPVVVDDVVAVATARTGLEVGRAIDVADAELGEVRDSIGGALEAEVGVQLHSIRGARDLDAAVAARRRARGARFGWLDLLGRQRLAYAAATVRSSDSRSCVSGGRASARTFSRRWSRVDIPASTTEMPGV